MEELTNSQKSIWVTEQYYKGTSINNICGTALIQEKVDFDNLEKAIQIFCKKHDNFWLELKIENGEVKQYLSEKEEVQMENINIANLKDLEEKRDKIAKKPFKLESSKLFRFHIFKFADGTGGFIINVHHLIADAWTLSLVSNEIMQIYSELKNNQKVEETSIYSYIDYIKSEKEYQKSEKFNKDKIFWQQIFENIPEVATIPGSVDEVIDPNNPKGKRKKYDLDKNFVLKIQEYCKQNKISAYNFFMAIYAIYIGEISNLDEFVIGTPILNRTNFKEKHAGGMFINMAPFKINMNQEIEFKEFVKNIAIDSLKMLKHQKYSYQCLLEDLREKNKNIPSLYNILLSYQITNTQQNEGNIKYQTEWTFNGYCAEDMDIQIYDINDTGNLSVSYDYKISKYNDKDIENIHNRILNIINQVIEKDDINIKDIDIVTAEEKEKLVIDFNKTELEYDKNIPIIKYFEKQVDKTPNNIAIVFEKQNITYKELNEKANSLAYELRKNGVINNTIVGILQERSFEMIIAILAVLKSGGSYIPIAPDYPNDRIEYMLEDSNASILLTNGNSRILTDKKIIDITNKKIYSKNKENLENISKPEDLSYLIYTSGSTGKPKGVMLKQQNLSNFYNSMKQTIDYLKDGKQHKILSITTVAFDIFAFESLMSLTRGLTVYMTNENEQKITCELERIIKENRVEIMQTTPSVMKFHLENIENKENLQSLKYIMLAGEPLPKLLVDKIKSIIPGVTIYNGYGPSETTIFSTTSNVTEQSKITIGRPIHNTQIYILNKNKKLLPQGTIGELYISGDGVGKGYINKKEQTKANFIQNPFIKGKTMYRVGDLGAFNENGEITCYGRVDNQVKINGLRIELGEIEECINKFKSDHLLKSVVIIKKIKEKSTLNAFVSYPAKIDKEKLRKYLNKKLPNYMQPSTITFIDKFPFTPNGKIDRKSLQKYKIDCENNEINYTEPRNEIEEKIVNVIKQKLDIEEFGIDNNIFDYGADSLTLINIITELFRYNYDIKVIDIYRNPTVRELYEKVIRKDIKHNGIVDYSKFAILNNKVKSFSKETNCNKIDKKYNILLTGATGFFGCHLLAELLKNTEHIGKIYCITRGKNDILPKDRLFKKINFYFGDILNDVFNKYVEVVEGELSNKQFSLENEEYNKLQKSVDIVIHSAANVNHYGQYANFEKANIISTQNIIDFCKNGNINLHYISTMTVSGNYLVKQNNEIVVFNENSFYIGQNFEDNVYSKSKLIAEALVLENINNGLNATIYRLGDLTGRYKDGVFQENINNNAIYLRLKSILEIGAISSDILQNDLEFSPVDYAAKAVKTIIWSDKCKNRIFNIFNPNMLITSELINIIGKANYVVKPLPKEEFNNLINKLSSSKETQKKVMGIVNDFTDNKDLIYNYTIKQDNKITCEYLKNLDFEWIQIDEKYIKKILEYMKKVKFID